LLAVGCIVPALLIACFAPAVSSVCYLLDAFGCSVRWT